MAQLLKYFQKERCVLLFPSSGALVQVIITLKGTLLCYMNESCQTMQINFS